MVTQITYTDTFKKKISKVRDAKLREKIEQNIAAVVAQPERGKPLRHSLKGDRVIRLPPFRIIYAYKNNELFFLNFDHRKNIYK